MRAVIIRAMQALTAGYNDVNAELFSKGTLNYIRNRNILSLHHTCSVLN